MNPDARARPAGSADLDSLASLENICFEPERRDSRSVICRSLNNPLHEVWIVDSQDADTAEVESAMYLRKARNSLRIHSLATRPGLQCQGRGSTMLRLAEDRARALNCRSLTLEADARRRELVDWYERRGFRRARLLPAYYAPGWDAWRLKRDISPAPSASHAT